MKRALIRVCFHDLRRNGSRSKALLLVRRIAGLPTVRRLLLRITGLLTKGLLLPPVWLLRRLSIGLLLAVIRLLPRRWPTAGRILL